MNSGSVLKSETIFYGCTSITIISLLSLTGLIFIPFIKGKWRNRWMQVFIALAVSTLSSDALLHILPQVVGVHDHLHHDHGHHGHSHTKIEQNHSNYHHHNNSDHYHLHHDHSDSDHHHRHRRHSDHDHNHLQMKHNHSDHHHGHSHPDHHHDHSHPDHHHHNHSHPDHHHHNHSHPDHHHHHHNHSDHDHIYLQMKHNHSDHHHDHSHPDHHHHHHNHSDHDHIYLQMKHNHSDHHHDHSHPDHHHDHSHPDHHHHNHNHSDHHHYDHNHSGHNHRHRRHDHNHSDHHHHHDHSHPDHHHDHSYPDHHHDHNHSDHDPINLQMEHNHSDHHHHQGHKKSKDEVAHSDDHSMLLKMTAVIGAVYILYVLEFISASPMCRKKNKATKAVKTFAVSHNAWSDGETGSDKSTDSGYGHVTGIADEPVVMCGLKSAAFVIIFGDAIHNFIDGIAVGASFVISNPFGIATSIAVACHELPHELGDFAVLIESGLSIPRAMLLNFLSSLTAFAGLFVGLAAISVDSAVEILLAITAGMFLYVAWLDMLIHLKKESASTNDKWYVTLFLQNIGFISGFLIMFIIGWYEEVLASL